MIPIITQMISAIRDSIPKNAGDPGINNRHIKVVLAMIPISDITFLNGAISSFERL